MAEPGYVLRGKRVWVAGHAGMVGAAVVRRLARENCDVITVSRTTLDLRDPAATSAWTERERPQVVVLAAAKVGGILANQSAPADFLFDNLMIQANMVEAAFRAGVEKLLILGSSCIYPKDAPIPLREEALLTGPLELTNEAYAVAKIAGLKLGQAYRRQHGFDVITAMPCNLYGPGDHYDRTNSHVMAALIRKAHEGRGAPAMSVWGSGKPRREFLHVDDCADALVMLLKAYSEEPPINVGSGEDVAIADLAQMVTKVVGFTGDLVFDPTKPDGVFRKQMDGSRLAALGWRSTIGLEDGIADAYADFLRRHG